jgi:hypothetical protein
VIVMAKPRGSIGPRARGWLLALFLLAIPAPAMAGVEWTEALSPSDPVVVATEGGEFRIVELRITLADGDNTDRGPVLEMFRGIEWT